jgi:hypothetical protein
MTLPMRLLRGMSFASYSFSYLDLDGLDRLVSVANGVEHEFIDPNVEVLRKELAQAGRALFRALHGRTARLPYNDWSAVPLHWEKDQPQRYNEAVSVLDAAALKVCEAYDALVRLSRARLSP